MGALRPDERPLRCFFEFSLARPRQAGVAASMQRPSLRAGCPALLTPPGGSGRFGLRLHAAVHKSSSLGPPCGRAAPAALRPGPEALAFARHRQSSGLSVSGLSASAPHRRRHARLPRPCHPPPWFAWVAEHHRACRKVAGGAGGAPMRRRAAQPCRGSPAPQAADRARTIYGPRREAVGRSDRSRPAGRAAQGTRPVGTGAASKRHQPHPQPCLR